MTPAVRRVPDVGYGEVPGYRPLELDLYLPEGDHGAPLPVIVHVHGGGWRRGSRRDSLPAIVRRSVGFLRARSGRHGGSAVFDAVGGQDVDAPVAAGHPAGEE